MLRLERIDPDELVVTQTNPKSYRLLFNFTAACAGMDWCAHTHLGPHAALGMCRGDQVALITRGTLPATQPTSQPASHTSQQPCLGVRTKIEYR